MHTNDQTTDSQKATRPVPTQILTKQNTYTKFSKKLVSSILPLVKKKKNEKKKKKHNRLGQAGFVNHSVYLSIPY